MPRTRMMERATLEAASLEQLQKEVKRFRLPLSEDRKILIETIMSHLEKIGSTELAREERGEAASLEHLVTATALHHALARITETILQQQREMQKAQNQFMTQVLQEVRSNGTGNERQEVVSRNEMGENGESRLPRAGSGTMDCSPARQEIRPAPYAADVSTGNVVNWLASQIPEFGGTTRDMIHILIGGIPQNALRATALSVADTSLDVFLLFLQGERTSSIRLSGSTESTRDARSTQATNGASSSSGVRGGRGRFGGSGIGGRKQQVGTVQTIDAGELDQSIAV